MSAVHGHIEKMDYHVDSTLKINDCEPLGRSNNNSCGYMEILKYENDSIYYDWTGKENRLKLDLHTYSMHDTVVIVCDQISEFYLKFGLFKDSCLIGFRTVEPIYDRPNFFSESKLVLNGMGKLPCLKQSLKLSKKPSLNEGEIIEGVFDFQSIDYWYLKKEEDKRYKIKLKAHFRVEISENKLR